MILICMSLALALMGLIAFTRRAPEPGCSFALRELVAWSDECDELDLWVLIDGLTQAGIDAIDAMAWRRHVRRRWLADALERSIARTGRAQEGRALDLKIQAAALFVRRSDSLSAEAEVVREATRGLSALRFDRFDAWDGDVVPLPDTAPDQIAIWQGIR